ncbi:MAG: hypothetical protein Q7S92_02070 [Candidatus Diapherotrites archaeon]|nr:hypothetical protein [Candidatus Diapherotrites archaeon]
MKAYKCTLCGDLYHSPKGAKICCGHSFTEVDVKEIPPKLKQKEIPHI